MALKFVTMSFVHGAMFTMNSYIHIRASLPSLVCGNTSVLSGMSVVSLHEVDLVLGGRHLKSSVISQYSLAKEVAEASRCF